eukprot:3911846-Amphidinium_carterae.1
MGGNGGHSGVSEELCAWSKGIFSDPICAGSSLTRQPRIAGSLTSDSWVDSVYEGPMTSIRKSADLRYIAQKAYAEQQHRDRLLLAVRGRHRLAPTQVTAGQRVWVWRRPLRGCASGWYGPGLVIATEGHNNAYVHIRGSLWRVTPRVPTVHLRHQSHEDRIGWDMVQRFLSDDSDLRHGQAAEQPLRRKYVDCTREPPPTVEPQGQQEEHEQQVDGGAEHPALEEEQVQQAGDQASEQEYAPTEVVESGDDDIDPAVAPQNDDEWRQAGTVGWILYHKRARSHFFVPQGGMLDRGRRW